MIIYMVDWLFLTGVVLLHSCHYQSCDEELSHVPISLHQQLLLLLVLPVMML